MSTAAISRPPSSAYYDVNHHGSFYSPHKEAVVNLNRAPSAHFSRHFHTQSSNNINQYNAAYNNENAAASYAAEDHDVENKGMMRPSTSLTRLYNGRRAMVDDFRGNSNMRPWQIETTSKRDYRFDDEGFHHSRSGAFRPRATLKIAVEGERSFSPEKRESYPAHYGRALFEARPPAQVRPNSVFISQGRISSRTEARDEYGEPRLRTYGSGFRGSSFVNGYGHRSNSPMDVRQENDGGGVSYGGRSPTSMDPRFKEGSTTQSTYRGLSNSLDDLRPTTAMRRSWTSTVRTGLEGEFDDRVTSKEHFSAPVTSYARQMPEIRPSLMPVPKGEVSRGTTYRELISERATFEGLRPKRRFEPSLKRPDEIDWM